MLFVKDRGEQNFTTARGSKCNGGKRFSLYNIRPDGLWAPPCLLYNAHWGSFPGVKQPDRVVDQKPPF